MRQGQGLNLSFYQLAILFLSCKIIGCGYINVAVGPNSPIQALDDEVNLKINYGQSGTGGSNNTNYSNTPIAITEGNQLIVSISLTSKFEVENSFQLSLEGSNGEDPNLYFDLTQNTFTIPVNQTDALFTLTLKDDSTFRNQTRWTLKVTSSNSKIISRDTLTLDLADNDSNPGLAPTATLAGTPSSTSNSTLLSITVGGTNVSSYYYKLGPSLTTICSSIIGYSTELAISLPIQDNIGVFTDGSLVLCVVGKDTQGNTQSYSSATMYAWTKDVIPATATLSGVPTGTNNTESLNITVQGTDVVAYQFKVGESGSTSCSNSSGYSSDVLVAQNIQSNIASLSNTNILLCVIGKDLAGNYQPLNSATSASWIKDTESPLVTSVTTALSNGAYKEGSNIDIIITFSKSVIVLGGTPTLSLNAHASAVASYISGSSSTELTFRYTVAAGHSSTDLNYALTSDLNLNGASIRDSLNNNANLTLPALAGGNDLGSLKNIYIDTTVPSVPSNLLTAQWSKSTTQSPTISFTNGSDGQSGLNHHEVKIYSVTAGTDVTAFATIANGASISGLGLTNTNIYRFILKAVDEAGNSSGEVSSSDWTVDSSAPTSLGAITTGIVPTNYLRETPTFTFSDSTDTTSGLSHYKIEVRKTSDNSTVVSYTTATGTGSGLTYSSASNFLTSGESYYASIRAVDNAGNESLATSTAANPWIAFSCPTQYVAVPALAPYSNTGFCVAKFEMKIQGITNGFTTYDSTYVAESRATGTPWVAIKRDEAVSECQSLGAGYDLISNAQWQAMARNMDFVASNWVSGVVGSQGMYRGHSDGSAGVLSVSDVSNPYNQTGNTAAQAWLSGKEQRRTMYLSNGQEVWDVGANVQEWVKDDNITNFGSNIYANQITDANRPTSGTVGSLTGTAKYLFGPAGAYTGLGSPEYGGMGHASFGTTSTNCIARSASTAFAQAAGIFAADAYSFTTTTVGAGIGFRCVYTPP